MPARSPPSLPLPGAPPHPPPPAPLPPRGRIAVPPPHRVLPGIRPWLRAAPRRQRMARPGAVRSRCGGCGPPGSVRLSVRRGGAGAVLPGAVRRCGAGAALRGSAQLSSARRGAVRPPQSRSRPAAGPARRARPTRGRRTPRYSPERRRNGRGRTDGRGVGRTDGDGTRIRRWGRADTGTAERGWGRTDGGRRDGRVGAELSEPLRPLKGIGPRFGAAPPPPPPGHSGTGPAGHGGGLQPPQKGLRAALRGRGAPSLSLHPEQQQLKSAAAINSCRQRSGVPRQHPHTNTGLTAQPLWAHWG